MNRNYVGRHPQAQTRALPVWQLAMFGALVVSLGDSHKYALGADESPALQSILVDRGEASSEKVKAPSAREDETSTTLAAPSAETLATPLPAPTPLGAAARSRIPPSAAVRAATASDAPTLSRVVPATAVAPPTDNSPILNSASGEVLSDLAPPAELESLLDGVFEEVAPATIPIEPPPAPRPTNGNATRQEFVPTATPLIDYEQGIRQFVPRATSSAGDGRNQPSRISAGTGRTIVPMRRVLIRQTQPDGSVRIVTYFAPIEESANALALNAVENQNRAALRDNSFAVPRSPTSASAVPPVPSQTPGRTVGVPARQAPAVNQSSVTRSAPMRQAASVPAARQPATPQQSAARTQATQGGAPAATPVGRQPVRRALRSLFGG